MIKGNITFIICILLLQITLPLIIQAQESKTNKLAQEPISRYLQLPPHLTFVLSCIEKENDSSSLRGRVGFQFSGNSLPSESFFIGWRNAMLFEKSTKDVYGFYSGVYGNVEEMYGIQISTLNESLKMEGVQIAIFANLSNAGNGVQISAIMNSASNWNGIQLSLGGNQILSSKQSEKNAENYLCQMALININEQEKGVLFQIGIFNRSVSRCLQIGILNYSEKAFFKYFPIINF